MCLAKSSLPRDEHTAREPFYCNRRRIQRGIEQDVIWTIYTIENLGNHELLYRNSDPLDQKYSREDIQKFFRNRQSIRTPGYFFKLKDAIKCVVENWNDIYEGSYKHVVIEKVGEGPYPIADVYGKYEIWFEWQGSWEDGGYKRVPKPECTEQIVNWGIG